MLLHNKIKLLSILMASILPFALHSQDKMKMDESVYAMWNSISGTQISNNGDWISYNQGADNKDKTLKIFNTRTRKSTSYQRSSKAKFSNDGKYLFFTISTAKDSIKEMKRRKVKKKDMPKDTLGILNLSSAQLEKVPNVKSFKVPEKWDGKIVYHLEPEKAKKAKKDTSDVEPKPVKKIKAEDKENGSKLIIRDLSRSVIDTILYVSSYAMSEESENIILASTGDDSTFLAGVYHYNSDNVLHPIFRSEGEYKSLSIDKTGTQAAFIANVDTTKALHPPYQLFYWNQKNDTASKIADRKASSIVSSGWDISPDQELLFSENGTQLFYGVKPNEVLQDTSLIDEEIVKVEVWNYQDGKLYTQQEVQESQLKKKSYLRAFNTKTLQTRVLGTEDITDVRLNREGTSGYALGYTEKPYLKNISWLGYAYKDLYKIDVATGEHKTIANKIQGNVRVSPGGKYFYWYSSPDTAYFAFSTKTDKLSKLTDNKSTKYYNELHDSPSLPRGYGIAGWTDDDNAMLIYDRYDIWSIDPSGLKKPNRLTNGRSSKVSHRIIVLDREENYLPNDRLLLKVFDEKDKSSGYSMLDLKTRKIDPKLIGDFDVTTRVIKAKNSNDIVYTKQSFTMYPDLFHSTLDFANEARVSIANPQQEKYNWGTIELFSWTNPNGKEVDGLLVKPDGFDPKKKYPVIVNFYEKSSNGLHRHRPPLAHRSTISYSFYVNSGYIIFNPDVHYEDGYPGKSCYDNVISGVEALLKEGYVDKDRVGVQGHSWGGYQIAHLLTKTNIFKCAEAGAPVVNMVSAYGGIRWGSGMSRMFQYEKTQSRLGATLWERPDLYLENSPIFNIDKVNTPVLIMHNDEDGAVPWYQGIEYFVALRRLGKPAWMLNYNGEPHWPLKWQNRLDFNIRMKQFFDHYLMNEPMPRWMGESIPARQKGISLGYETDDGDKSKK